MIKKAILFVAIILSLQPPLAAAQLCPEDQWCGRIFPAAPEVVVAGVFGTILGIIWMVALAFVIIMFTLAGFKFLTAQGDPNKVSEARSAVIWGVVGTIVIVLAWSAIVIVRLELGV